MALCSWGGGPASDGASSDVFSQELASFIFFNLEVYLSLLLFPLEATDVDHPSRGTSL